MRKTYRNGWKMARRFVMECNGSGCMIIPADGYEGVRLSLSVDAG